MVTRKNEEKEKENDIPRDFPLVLIREFYPDYAEEDWERTRRERFQEFKERQERIRKRIPDWTEILPSNEICSFKIVRVIQLTPDKTQLTLEKEVIVYRLHLKVGLKFILGNDRIEVHRLIDHLDGCSKRCTIYTPLQTIRMAERTALLTTWSSLIELGYIPTADSLYTITKLLQSKE